MRTNSWFPLPNSTDPDTGSDHRPNRSPMPGKHASTVPRRGAYPLYGTLLRLNKKNKNFLNKNFLYTPALGINILSSGRVKSLVNLTAKDLTPRLLSSKRSHAGKAGWEPVKFLILHSYLNKSLFKYIKLVLFLK